MCLVLASYCNYSHFCRIGLFIWAIIFELTYMAWSPLSSVGALAMVWCTGSYAVGRVDYCCGGAGRCWRVCDTAHCNPAEGIVGKDLGSWRCYKFILWNKALCSMEKCCSFIFTGSRATTRCPQKQGKITIKFSLMLIYLNCGSWTPREGEIFIVSWTDFYFWVLSSQRSSDHKISDHFHILQILRHIKNLWF